MTDRALLPRADGMRPPEPQPAALDRHRSIWSPACRRSAALVGGSLLLLALMVRHNIAFSLASSRLATVPRYDDVVYLLDGVSRLKLLHEGGLPALAANLIGAPPHAPISTFTAMLGFGLFGPVPASAYVANAWILALYIGALGFISRPLGGVTARLLFVAVFLFAPVCHAMITEFRPDMAAGLLFAMAVAAVLTVDLAAAGRGPRLAIAALAVVATIAKPSGSIVVIPGLGVALIVSLALQWRIGGHAASQLLRKAALVILAYAVMLLPFAAILGPQTVSYIYQALVGNADVWRTPASSAFHWSYHLLGAGARQALRPLGQPGIAVLVADAVLLARSGGRAERTAGFGFLLMLVFLYVPMALSAEKTPFQGSYFYLPFLLAVALAAVRLSERVAEWSGRRWIVPLLLAGVVVLLGQRYPLASSYTALPRYARELQPLLDATVQAVADASANWRSGPLCPDGQPALLATNPDPLVPEAVVLAALTKGVTLRAQASFLARTKDEVDAFVARSQLVLIADPAMPDLNAWLPGSAFGAATLAGLRDDAAWTGRIVGRIEGAPLWLFERTACMRGSG